MEDLNKTQIILLALLVSFVSSVATSIMTYSLLVEAPPTVTQTVNRVVERTIETVTPTQTRPDVVTREVTVVVQEEDLVIDAIAENESSLVRILRSSVVQDQDEGGEEKIFHGIGLVLNEGLIVSVSVGDAESGASFEARLSDGTLQTLTLSHSSENFSFFQLSQNLDLRPAVLGDSNSLQLGQTVITIKGRDRNSVSLGRIAGLIRGENQNEEISGPLLLVETDFSLEEGSRGGPVLNLKGEIVGFNTTGVANFVPVNIIKEDVTKIN